MPYKDPEKQKEYYLKNKEKIKKQRKEYQKQYREKHKYEKKELMKKYFQTEQGKKSTRITKWKHRGILFHDYNLLYDIYLQTTHCDNCHCLLNQCKSSLKCVDHDHNITDDENVRNILCLSCNFVRR